MVKRASRTIIEKHYPKLTLDFDTNKKITDEVSLTPSKRVRNKIAGFITHLMKRIQRGGSVRGISLKLQEEERERRLDFLPERSALDLDVIDVDADTFALLKSLEYDDIPGVRVAVGLGAAPTGPQRGGRPGGQRGGDRNQQRDGQRGGDRKPGTQAGQERKPRAGAAAPTAAATTPA